MIDEVDGKWRETQVLANRVLNGKHVTLQVLSTRQRWKKRICLFLIFRHDYHTTRNNRAVNRGGE